MKVGTESSRQTCMLFGLLLGAAVGDPDWPKLLADYEAAVENFAQLTRALTAALLDGKAANEDMQALLAAETRARNTLGLMRMRVVNHWRASQAELGSVPLPYEDDDQYVS
jgi:hypothetical protein